MRGRPVKSQIRQNIVELLYFIGEGYGYEIYKHYIAIFPKATMRSIYYHLRKGEATQEITIKEIRHEQGHYSWGQSVEKIYYTLGPNAKPRILDNVKEYFKK